MTTNYLGLLWTFTWLLAGFIWGIAFAQRVLLRDQKRLLDETEAYFRELRASDGGTP